MCENAGFFNHQYFWKEPIDILDYVDGDGHQERLVCEIITLIGYGCLLFN